ncbi:hypothetical protein FA10DRAFT_288240 [Acaromyces ingoldii]|uniref:Uncharacterized protein n=1 Tax=Acaromyces ingoldii TaxID=215250 RepID=A0A316YIQ5_9BASI|nr:hypothetical protein FA10DRAFT_288240 [Acaromyces ingoldii]PWN88714.1 hypothetical protein FA10DRAFT_288240 [Acaromyces ingoldii]
MPPPSGSGSGPTSHQRTSMPLESTPVPFELSLDLDPATCWLSQGLSSLQWGSSQSSQQGQSHTQAPAIAAPVPATPVQPEFSFSAASESPGDPSYIQLWQEQVAMLQVSHGDALGADVQGEGEQGHRHGRGQEQYNQVQVKEEEGDEEATHALAPGDMTVAQKVVFVLDTVAQRALTHGFVDKKLKKFASRVGSGEHHFHRAFPKVVGLTFGAFSIASCHLAIQDAAGCDTPFDFEPRMTASSWKSKRINSALGEMEVAEYRAGLRDKTIYAIYAETIYGRFALLYKEAPGGAFTWPTGLDPRTAQQPPRGSRVVALIDGPNAWERMWARCPHALLCTAWQADWLADVVHTLSFREQLSRQKHPEVSPADLARFRRARVYMTVSWAMEGADLNRVYQKRPAKVVTLEAMEEARQQRLVWEQTGNMDHVLKRAASSRAAGPAKRSRGLSMQDTSPPPMPAEGSTRQSPATRRN